MKSAAIGMGMLMTLAVCASDTNLPNFRDVDLAVRLARAKGSRYPLLISQQNDKMPVCIMEWLDSKTVHDFFPGHTVFRLISTRDPIHYASFSALLLDTNGVPTHLESDKDVADFLGDFTGRRGVSSTSDAMELVRAFAALRSYRIVESAPEFKDARDPNKRPAPLASDFKFFTEERKGEWRVYATLFTSEYGGSYERYIFTIYKKPGIGFYFSGPVLIRLRNRVY